MQHRQQRGVHLAEQLSDLGQRLRALRQRSKVAAGARAGRDAGHGTFEVRHVAQAQRKLFALDGLARQLLHGGKALGDLRGGEQGTLHPAAQQTAAHGRPRLVEHPEQAPALFLRAHGLRQLQIPPRREVEAHEAPSHVEIEPPDVRQVVFLQVFQRLQQRARRADGAGHRLQRVLFTKLRAKRRRAARKVKLRVGAAVDARTEPLAEHRADGVVLHGFAAEQRLGGQKAPKLVAGGFGPAVSARLRDVERAGRHVAECEAAHAVLGEEAGIIVVLRLRQHRAFCDGAGRYDPDDVPLHQPLGQRGIFHLFADRDLIALCDEARDVALRRVIGHAAHRRLFLGGFALRVVARGER